MLEEIKRFLSNKINFFSSSKYWEERYENGKNSGPGSYGNLAEFKAEVINSFVRENVISTVLEFGCGDGNQLSLCQYPNYIGIDVSHKAIEICKTKFSKDETKTFINYSDHKDERAEVCLSLDVIFHLVEDSTYSEYMKKIFESAEKYVVIYSSNHENNEKSALHVRHRKFTEWVENEKPEWELFRTTKNRYPFNGDINTTSFCDFYFYKRSTARERPRHQPN